MNLKSSINNFVEKNNFFPGQSLNYDQYLFMHSGLASTLNSFHRGLQDLISISAWTTSIEGIQHIAYLPMNVKQIHCAKIQFSNGMQTTARFLCRSVENPLHFIPMKYVLLIQKQYTPNIFILKTPLYYV